MLYCLEPSVQPNKNRLCAPSGPDAKTATRFPRRSGKRYAPNSVVKTKLYEHEIRTLHSICSISPSGLGRAIYSWNDR